MMQFRSRLALCASAAMLCLSFAAVADHHNSTLKSGTPNIQSAGVLAFGPDAILLVGDPMGAAIFAIDTNDRGPAGSGALDVSGISEKIASLLGTSADQILINDLAVNPSSGKAYLSVSRGLGPDATPVIVRVDSSGKLEEFSLKNVKFAKADLPNAPDANAKGRRGRSLRVQSITDLAYLDGQVYVAGLSNEEFSSKLRSIPFPFTSVGKGASVEIFHGAHGRFETNAPVRTFVPYEVDSEPYLLAAYTCTPLVKFSVADLKPGAKVMGTTIAELGNMNRPLDMIVYESEGASHLLLTNSNRGVMKIPTETVGSQEGITKRVGGGGTAGVSFETIDDLTGVIQMDRLDESRALIMIETASGSVDLKTIALP